MLPYSPIGFVIVPPTAEEVAEAMARASDVAGVDPFALVDAYRVANTVAQAVDETYGARPDITTDAVARVLRDPRLMFALGYLLGILSVGRAVPVFIAAPPNDKDTHF